MAKKNDAPRPKATAKPAKRRQVPSEVLVLIGKRLREVRLAKGHRAQDAFAIGSGIDRAYYSALERGERNVGILKLLEIAIALNVEVGDLVPPVQLLKPHLVKKSAK
jgi:transcriptional regulator with XRE-family HTH domain